MGTAAAPDDNTVIFDACVLYPAPLRDLLMWLALSGQFQARWTERIHDEWSRNLLTNRPDIRAEQLERVRRLMNHSVPEGLVVGFEPLIEGLALPDPDDRHVLAAAIEARAGRIVTFNLKDFPAETLVPYGVRAEHPDAFIVGLLDADVVRTCSAVARQRAALRNPPLSVDELLMTFQQQQLLRTADRLRAFAHRL